VNSYLKKQLNKQISSSETLSRKLKSSEAVNSYLNTTIDGLIKTVEVLNQTVRLLCGQIKHVSTCKIDAVDLLLMYVRDSGTSNLGQTFRFQLNVLLPSSGLHLGMVLCHWLYVQISVMVLSPLYILGIQMCVAAQ